MAIPVQQLISWSRPGARQGSATTYKSIKSALDAHQWPPAMDHHVYLQGSYPNHTNIRGDSDVDIVVESTNVFYHNVPEHLRPQYGLTTPGSYSWREFRAEVNKALVNYYGLVAVTDGNKSLKVAGHGNRLNADVVPCTTYRQYQGHRNYGTGMTFWTRNGVQIVNFPKAHLGNGTSKNDRCSTSYKPNVRMFKNARNRASNDFPSYFLECLAYNVPDRLFSSDQERTFVDVVNCLSKAVKAGSINSFRCQNEQQAVIGTEPHQVDLASAIRFVSAMVNLWRNWI